MFIGHWAPALAGAGRKHSPGLATLFIAGQLVDWGFFALLLFGVEDMHVVPGITAMNPMDLYKMPYSHSLIGSLGIAAAFGGLIALVLRDCRAGLIAGAVVLSHWFLDLLVHRPDLTLTGMPPKLGMGLWNHPLVEMPLELGIVALALWDYARRTRPAAARLTTLVVVLLILQAINWFGPAPSEVTPATSYLAFFAYGLATLCAWWVGKSAHPPVQAG